MCLQIFFSAFFVAEVYSQPSPLGAVDYGFIVEKHFSRDPKNLYAYSCTTPLASMQVSQVGKCIYYGQRWGDGYGWIDSYSKITNVVVSSESVSYSNNYYTDAVCSSLMFSENMVNTPDCQQWQSMTTTYEVTLPPVSAGVNITAKFESLSDCENFNYGTATFTMPSSCDYYSYQGSDGNWVWGYKAPSRCQGNATIYKLYNDWLCSNSAIDSNGNAAFSAPVAPSKCVNTGYGYATSECSGGLPTAQPTHRPTGPSVQPTRKPTRKPTKQPTMMPTTPHSLTSGYVLRTEYQNQDCTGAVTQFSVSRLGVCVSQSNYYIIYTQYEPPVDGSIAGTIDVSMFFDASCQTLWYKYQQEYYEACHYSAVFTYYASSDTIQLPATGLITSTFGTLESCLKGNFTSIFYVPPSICNYAGGSFKKIHFCAADGSGYNVTTYGSSDFSTAYYTCVGLSDSASQSDSFVPISNGCHKVTSSSGTSYERISCGQSTLPRLTSPPTPSPTHSPKEWVRWVLGAAGQTCDTVCKYVGRDCLDQLRYSKVDVITNDTAANNRTDGPINQGRWPRRFSKFESIVNKTTDATNCEVEGNLQTCGRVTCDRLTKHNAKLETKVPNYAAYPIRLNAGGACYFDDEYHGNSTCSANPGPFASRFCPCADSGDPTVMKRYEASVVYPPDCQMGYPMQLGTVMELSSVGLPKLGSFLAGGVININGAQGPVPAVTYMYRGQALNRHRRRLQEYNSTDQPLLGAHNPNNPYLYEYIISASVKDGMNITMVKVVVAVVHEVAQVCVTAAGYFEPKQPMPTASLTSTLVSSAWQAARTLPVATCPSCGGVGISELQYVIHNVPASAAPLQSPTAFPTVS